MAFTKSVPEWNAAGIEPPSTLKNSGFQVGYKPPADYFNWFWYNVCQCLLELQGMSPADIGAATAEAVQAAQSAAGTAQNLANAAKSAVDTHAAKQDNPHKVTAEQVGAAASTHNHAASEINSGTLSSSRLPTVPVTKGGTGATSAAAARTALGITPANIGALPTSGGSVTGPLTINDDIVIDSDKSFFVQKTFSSVPYRSYIKPINYSVGNNGDYSTGLIHYQNNASVAQMMFNKDGVMLRDNVNAKAYQIFGQHNGATAAASVRSHLYTYGETDMTAGTSTLDTGKLYLVYE